MSTYCCSMMEGNSTAYCGEHADDPASCPDVTVAWSWRHGPGLPIPSSAGGGQIAIRYCPWCATEISTVKEPTAEGDTCPLVQLDGRMSGQVTVDHSRMPASTVLALFLGGCEVERVLGMYPWLDGAQAAVLHRLAADLAAKGVVVAEAPDA